MKTLYESIWDPDFEPTVKNTSHKWQRHELKDGVSYCLLAKYGNPIVNKVLEPLVSKLKETNSRTAQSKLEKGDYILIHRQMGYDDYWILSVDVGDKTHSPVISMYEFEIGSSEDATTLVTKTVVPVYYGKTRGLFNNNRWKVEYYIMSLDDYNDIVALYNDIEKNSK